MQGQIYKYIRVSDNNQHITYLIHIELLAYLAYTIIQLHYQEFSLFIYSSAIGINDKSLIKMEIFIGNQYYFI